MKKVLLILAAIVGLTACGGPESGLVYGKYYYPAYDWVQMICSAYNSNGTCMVNVPIIQHEPERFQLGLRNGDEEGQTNVPEHAYKVCRNNEYYPECGSK